MILLVTPVPFTVSAITPAASAEVSILLTLIELSAVIVTLPPKVVIFSDMKDFAPMIFKDDAFISCS